MYVLESHEARCGCARLSFFGAVATTRGWCCIITRLPTQLVCGDQTLNIIMKQSCAKRRTGKHPRAEAILALACAAGRESIHVHVYDEMGSPTPFKTR